jgi:hypothetical protein
MTEENQSEFKFEKLSQIVKNITYAIIILSCLGVLGYFSDGEPGKAGLGIISLLIGWFITGPACWGWAYNKDRHEGFAFLWGFSFGLIGAAIYWIYTLFFTKNLDNWE